MALLEWIAVSSAGRPTDGPVTTVRWERAAPGSLPSGPAGVVKDTASDGFRFAIPQPVRAVHAYVVEDVVDGKRRSVRWSLANGVFAQGPSPAHGPRAAIRADGQVVVVGGV